MAVYLVLLIYSVFLVHWPQGQKGAFLSPAAASSLGCSSLKAVKWRPPSSREASFLERVARPKGKQHHPSSSIPCTNTRALPDPRKATKIVPLPELSLSTSPPLAWGRPSRGKGDIDGHKTINLLSRHNKSCSPVILRFQPAFPPSPAGWVVRRAGADG